MGHRYSTCAPGKENCYDITRHVDYQRHMSQYVHKSECERQKAVAVQQATGGFPGTPSASGTGVLPNASSGAPACASSQPTGVKKVLSYLHL